ncbi:MAG: PfkB family carbohydrate kinase [Anaerolineae bacterium]|nr:PfkB family carbohydrate kinase [Thermoflexales bacterium]MDW8396253.1 PfkB family carbohydrate kinase [Anaerolineae bacterium]
MRSAFRVACFGYVNPGVVFAVDAYPAPNTGAYVKAKRPFIGADCAMVAQVLAAWGVEAHLIGNALGDDALGHDTLSRLRALGVHTHLRLDASLRTPHEVDIADRAGTRTFFVEDNAPVWESLKQADLDAIETADMLYVDWYVGEEAALRAVTHACAHSVPVFLNVEVSLSQPELHRALIERATYAQSPMSDVHVHQEDPLGIAHLLREYGVEVAFVTRGKFGSLALSAAGLIECAAPTVAVVDTQGAGAVYSAAAIFSLLQGLPLPLVVQAATHTASLKCAQHELVTPSPLEVLQRA